MSDMVNRSVMANAKLGSWLSAALDDPNVCDEMKVDIREWFSAGEPVQMLCDRIAAMQADAAPVADTEDWRKAWRNVAIISSEHEGVRLNEAVVELHSAIEACTHPPIADAAPVAHCGDAGVPLCSACSVPIVELVQQPGCGAPMPVTDAAPVAWMYKRGSERKVYVDRSQAALACGYVETPLYAHPPVDDRVSTSSPVDVGETPETSDKLAALQTAADKLAGYAGHDEDCEIMKHGVWTDSIPCTCGYTDAWWAYEAAKQAKEMTCPLCDGTGYKDHAGFAMDPCDHKEHNMTPPPGAKWQLGQRVTKTKGSNWTGRIVGFYSTNLTPIGYAVESETDRGSVQIYPQAALQLA